MNEENNPQQSDDHGATSNTTMDDAIDNSKVKVPRQHNDDEIIENCVKLIRGNCDSENYVVKRLRDHFGG